MLSLHARRRVILPALLALTTAQLHPQAVPPGAAQTAPAPGHETLDYAIEWRLLNAGHAKLDWFPSSAVKGGWETTLHLESIGLVSRFFHVNDDYRAQMTSNLCATVSTMAAREGNRSRDTKITFDASARKADFVEKDLKTNKEVKHESEIPHCVHEVLGGLYTLRLMNLEPGKTTQIPVSNGKKMVYLRVEAQRREEIKVPVGPQKTIRYEVFAFDNQLYNRPGHLHIWLTDDQRRLPVQIEIRLQFTIGTITLRLNKEVKS
jgi:hypothetical protein